MRILKLSVLMVFGLSFAFSSSAEMTVMSLQERMRQSDAVVVGTIEEVRQADAGVEGQFSPPITHWLATCRVERYIIGPKIHNPAVEEAKAVKLIRIAFEQKFQKPTPVKLAEGKKYLLFLKETGPNTYEMITPYHGAFETGQDYFIHDEQSPEYPKAVKMSFEAIVSRLTNELALFIRPDKQFYAVGEEIGFTLDFKNVSAGNLQLFIRMLPQEDLTLRLYRINGNEKQDITPPIEFSMVIPFASDTDFKELLAQETFSKHMTLKDFLNDLTLSGGNYGLAVALDLPSAIFSHVTITPWTGRVQSNMIRFEIGGKKLSIKGSLAFPDGTKPLVATITVGNEKSYYQAASDEEGNYIFYDILPGRYNLLAFGVTGNKAAGVFIKKDIQVDASGPALEIPIVLEPPPEHIEGSLERGHGFR